MTGIFYTGEVGIMEQILQEISKFPEILGELSRRKQCVPGSVHALEPGDEASILRKYNSRTEHMPACVANMNGHPQLKGLTL